MTGVECIAAERKRQKEVEGWTPEHDAEHDAGELSIAAACYAINKIGGLPLPEVVVEEYDTKSDRFKMIDAWPWDESWDKREKHDRIRSLVIAGALIAAEIDRLIDAAENF